MDWRTLLKKHVELLWRMEGPDYVATFARRLKTDVGVTDEESQVLEVIISEVRREREALDQIVVPLVERMQMIEHRDAALEAMRSKPRIRLD